MVFNYDVIVIGGGHAGCEAATAAANMGAKTCLITMDMNKIGQMSCNPAIGGIAKGQIVREIDALGGQMAMVTDNTAIQFRMLNRGKGPAVWSPRAQCDRGKFIWEWRRVLDNTPNLDIWQDQVWYQVGKNENRHTCENRQAERTLRGHGGSAWRERLPQVQLHGTREETAAASMLDMLYQQGGPRHPERKDC